MIVVFAFATVLSALAALASSLGGTRFAATPAERAPALGQMGPQRRMGR